jgi:hypothetical protein
MCAKEIKAMAFTNFSNGVSSFGIPLFGTAAPLTYGPPTGNVFFVGSTGNNNASGANGSSPGSPYLTLAYAISQATASNGDIIYLLPNTTTTISSATSLLLNKAGITIVGLGLGNQRPLFDFTTANTATIPVSANGINIQNCRFRASFLSIATAFTLTTATYFSLVGNKFFDASNVLNFLNIVTSTGIANTVDGLTAINNQWGGLGTTSVNSFILSANDIEAAIWQNNNITLARTATAAILATITAGVLTNLVCTGNSAISAQVADTGGALVNVGGTTSTGILANNYLSDLTTSTDLIAPVASGLRFQQNFKTGVVTASGFLSPAADS